MKATLVVAAREIAERKLVLLGALLLGLVPLAIPLLPGLGGTQARDVRFTAALFLSLTIFVAFPVAFGATVMVSEIVQKRITFYFSRPLSSASIWGGKMLGALIICVCGACLAAVPTVIVDGKRALAAFDPDGPATAIFLLSTLLLLVAAHVLSSMVRLRSVWIVLDFFLAIALAAAIAFSLRSLFLAGFWSVSDMQHFQDRILWWLAASAIGVLLIASYVQIADGRTDARRSHGALSATLWGLLLLVALPLAGLAWWVNAATPKDIDEVYGSIQPSPHGSWLNVSGTFRARGSTQGRFLYDAASGRFVKRTSFLGDGGFVFSGGGTRAAWLQVDPGVFEWKLTGRIRIAALDAAEPVAIVSDVEASLWAQLALSPSGQRLAISNADSLAVYDVSSPSHARQILAVKRERGYRPISFVGEDTIRFSPGGFGAMQKGTVSPRELEIEEVDLSSKKSLVTGRVENGTLPDLRVRVSADGRRLIEARGRLLTLHDARTGAFLATLSEDLEAPKMRILSGDRLVVAGVANGKGVLKIFLEVGRARSAPSSLVELGPAASVVLGGEIAPGRIAVALNSFRSNDERARRAWKLAFVDVTTGAVSSGPDGLVPADRFAWWFSPTLPPAEAGSPASRLFLDADSRLVRLDPATGAQTVLLGRSK